MNKFEYFSQLHYPNCIASVKKYSDYIRNQVILDIGSNIGLYSQAIIEHLPYKEIHLFEPSKELIEYSQILLQKFPGIYYNNVALGLTNRSETLYKSSDYNIGWNTILTKDPIQNNDFTQYMNKETINIVNLDDQYKNIDSVGFIKIDVEGYERYVLEGSLQIIEKFKPAILVEVCWGQNHPEWNLNLMTYHKLFDLGYKKVNFHPTNTEDILFTI